jgi:hypothetical protein
VEIGKIRGRRKEVSLALNVANNQYAGFGPGTANLFRKNGWIVRTILGKLEPTTRTTSTANFYHLFMSRHIVIAIHSPLTGILLKCHTGE